jgi:hypothetical protein
VRWERDDALDGREGAIDGAVVPERGVATQALPNTPRIPMAELDNASKTFVVVVDEPLKLRRPCTYVLH